MFVASSSIAQDEVVFQIELSRDSVLFGNAFEISYLLKNAKQTRIPIPEFENFIIVGGPNQSSSMTIINGDISQESSLSFMLQAKDLGVYAIPGLEIEIDGIMHTTDEVTVVILPNENNLKQNPHKEHLRNKPKFDLPQKKVKKKRKVYRI